MVLVRALVSIVLLAVSFSAVASGSPLMSLPGKFSVSPTGGAQYSIPIRVPPGVNGMEPKLSFEYNSQGRSGIMGLGWSISGLSSIYRCPKTRHQDGGRSAVQFASGDQFCLDGERLILVGGTHGSPGAEYRTERDTLARIRAVGQAVGGGPLGFTVEAKNGQTLEYGFVGGDYSAAIGAAGIPQDVVRVWALARVTDVSGNRISYRILRDAGNGSYYLDRIEYTDNPALGLKSENVVQFVYETRPDVITGWQGGAFSRETRRLTTVRTSTRGGVGAFEYRVGYAQGRPAGEVDWSEVSSIQLCAFQSSCLPAQTFTTNSPASSTALSWWTAIPFSGGVSFNFRDAYPAMDLNGDGRADLISENYRPGSGQYVVCLSAGDRFDCSTIGGPRAKPLFADFNGDGRTDIIAMGGAEGNLWDLCFWNGGPSFNCSRVPAHNVDVGIVIGDFNGDGMADIAGMAPGTTTWHVCYSTGTAFECTYVSAHPYGASGSWGRGTLVGDFNGDGRSDMAGVQSEEHDVWTVCYATDLGFDCSQHQLNRGGIGFQLLGDFNGDGMTDFGFRIEAPNVWRICMSTGKAFSCSEQAGPGYSMLDGAGRLRLRVGDYNGDGLTDTAAYSGANGIWELCLGTGQGFRCHERNINHAWYPIAGDFDGDGLTDLFVGSDGQGLMSKTVAPSREVARFSNSLGQTVDASYEKLPRLRDSVPRRYAPTTAASGDVIPFTAPLTVIAESTHSTPGASKRVGYWYGTALFQRGGRGFLGFESVTEAEDPGLGLKRYFRVDFPYTGLVHREEKGLSSTSWYELQWSTISTTTTEYGCLNPATAAAAPCQMGVGARYFVYPRDVVVTSRELDLSALPGSRTQVLEVDRFGNVLRERRVKTDPDGSESPYTTEITNTYFNDEAGWRIGKLVRRAVASSGPDVPSPVVPGSGSGDGGSGSQAVSASVMSAILQLLLDD